VCTRHCATNKRKAIDGPIVLAAAKLTNLNIGRSRAAERPLELDGPRFEFLIIFFSVEISFCPVKPDFVIGQGAPSKRKG
jgi:hypothetical protein